ncbi:hypothetical protein [Streptomyces sp. CA-111067]|uniref:hypothetical protein n=1 Tax=Streptomyces sp. CA-111067 TaxID=3240046 RepID=UPI003D969201
MTAYRRPSICATTTVFTESVWPVSTDRSAAASRSQWGTETEQIPRARSGAKRDARQGVTGPDPVLVVRVNSAHCPARQAADDDAARRY